MHASDLMAKKRVVSLRPDCCSSPELSGCRMPRARPGARGLRPPAAAGGRPGSIVRLPEPEVHAAPLSPPRNRYSGWCALSAQAVHAAGGPGRSTSRRQVPDVAAGGGARRRVSIDRLRFRDGARRGRRRELFEAAPPLVGAPAGRHPYGRRSSDGRALLVVLVFEGPSSVIYKRLSPFFAYLELRSSRNLDQTVVCGLRDKPVDSPK